MENDIQFVYGDKEIKVKKEHLKYSVLNYLRTIIKDKSSKEGCGGGDCGACTVIIGEFKNNKVEYRTINSCVTIIGSLNNKILITAKILSDLDVNPLQKAILSAHATQCGFCTPGVIMSMTAYYLNSNVFHRKVAINYLSGNLCRCTGYQPILDACEKVFESKTNQLSSSLIKLESKLKCLISNSIVSEYNGSYSSPKSVSALNKLLCDIDNFEFIGGGTNIIPEYPKSQINSINFISLSEVDEMKHLIEDEEYLYIGGSVSIEDTIDFIGSHYFEAKEYLNRFAAMQIRNTATFGGNLANGSPISDSSIMFMAMNAELIIGSATGERKILCSDFFIDYKSTKLKTKEYIKTILIPKDKERFFKIIKNSKRFHDDISICSVSFSGVFLNEKISEAIICINGMDSVPRRASLVEKMINNKNINEISQHMIYKLIDKSFNPLSDTRASSVYRLQIASSSIYRFLMELKLKEGLRISDYA